MSVTNDETLSADEVIDEVSVTNDETLSADEVIADLVVQR